MKILLIHLSDIHFEKNENPAFERKEAFIKSFQNYALEADALFMLITGDIAAHGKSEEYKVAKVFFNSVIDSIRKYTKKDLNGIIVPGNHDCDHDLSKSLIRETLIKNVHDNGDDATDDGVVDTCCSIQLPYFDFESCYKDKQKELFSSKLVNILEYCYVESKIVFNCYNSAWISQKKEQQGKMFIPLSCYPDKFLDKKYDLNISILHHTFNWQNCINSRDLMRHLEKTSDIIFTGHEHVSSKNIKDDIEGNYTEFIEGGVFQCQNDKSKSDYNLVTIDFDNNEQIIINYDWNGEIYSKISEVTRSYIGLENRRLRKKIFDFNENFDKKLKDPGTSFTHPNKSKLVLEDVFVYPNLRVMNVGKYDKNNEFDRILNSKRLLNLNKENNKLLIVGASKSGRTALCHMLFVVYHNFNYIPIYVDGYRINAYTIKRFNKLVNKCFVEQYSKEDLEKFEQFENTRKIIFIDDFDEVRLNMKNKSILLANIDKLYPNLFVIADDLFQLEKLVHEGDGYSFRFEEYDQYKVLEFGHVLRHKLIKKWNILGQDVDIDEDEILRRIDQSQQILNMVIGKNYVPSYPVFLLTILQTTEINNPHDVRYSSYGYYYEVLITQALGRINKKPEEINAFYSYITELANHIFEKRTREISEDALKEFHDWFCKEYAVSPKLDYYIRNFVDSDILEVNGCMYIFKYKYIFCFFVARYMAKKLEEGDVEIRNIVSKLCKRLYRTLFSDIIMFLTYHSTDPFIIDEILNNTRSLFVEYAPMNLKNDIKNINSLIDEMPKLVVENRNIHEERIRELKKKDDDDLLEEDNGVEEDGSGIDEAVEELDIASNLNLAFKTIEIIGQIMKNYYSSLKGFRKKDLGEEACLIGLRALKPFCEALEKNKDELVDDIRNFVEKKKIVGDDKIEKISKRLLYRLCQMVIYSFIKKISLSIGSENLKETYKQIVEERDWTSMHLINLSIKLEFFEAFPYDDIKKMKNLISNSYLPFHVLQQMVINYLYMFPTSYEERQRICSLVEISMSEQRLISEKSTRKKVNS